jgi:hypothetical protein
VLKGPNFFSKICRVPKDAEYYAESKNPLKKSKKVKPNKVTNQKLS